MVSLPPEGQVMLISQILHRKARELEYYGDAVSQPSLAKRIADQINELANAHLDSSMLSQFHPQIRRTRAKLHDLTVVWREYEKRAAQGFVDITGAWQSALRALPSCDLLRGADLMIYGFGYISFELIDLIEAALPLAASVTVGLVCDDRSPDKQIFRTATDSLATLRFHLQELGLPFREEVFRELPPMDPGISYVENTIYAMGTFREGSIQKVGPNHYVIIREDASQAKEAALKDLSDIPIPDLSSSKLWAFLVSSSLV